MALQEIPTLDTAIAPIIRSRAPNAGVTPPDSGNSWSTPPLGFLLLIEEGPVSGPSDDFYLLIDGVGNRLLVA